MYASTGEPTYPVQRPHTLPRDALCYICHVRLMEAVPNVSEGRRPGVIAALTTALTGCSGGDAPQERNFALQIQEKKLTNESDTLQALPLL